MMKSSIQGQVIGIPLSSASYAAKELQAESAGPFMLPVSYLPTPRQSIQVTKDSAIRWMSKLGRRADSYVQAIRQHVSLGPKISEIVNGKLSLNSRIIQAGGVERVFRQDFHVKKEEKLLKASQCYLSTTAGPIAGMLFVSTEKIAFHSDTSLKLTSSKGELARVPDKVLVPLGKIRSTISRVNADKPNQKYIQIVTADDFEFWFMGFLCGLPLLSEVFQAFTASNIRITVSYMRQTWVF